MKTLWQAAALIGILATPVAAEVEVTPFLGFQAGGAAGTRQGDLEIDPSANLGLVVSLRTRPDGLIEFIYSRQETTLSLDDIFGTAELFDLNVEYFHFGGLWEIKQERVRPILGLSVGATRLSPQADEASDEWLFSAAISGGAKIGLSERIALRVEGRGLINLFSSSGGIFCGFPPGQCAVSLSGSTLAQIDALVGLAFRF